MGAIALFIGPVKSLFASKTGLFTKPSYSFNPYFLMSDFLIHFGATT
jgi:hypothetical protein